MARPKQLTYYALQGLPHFRPGDDLGQMLYASIQENGLFLQDGDILILAQKIVSKAEGRLVNLTTVTPSPEAVQLAKYLEKRPELVELILQESNEVVRARPGTIIVEHKSGFICANAGIDHSNVKGSWGNDEDWVLLLPEDADLSAAMIRAELEVMSGVRLGVLIIDSHGRAWRNGVLGTTIGASGLPALLDMRGEEDMYQYKLRVTTIAAADELAAGGSLMMGQAGEGTPVVLARGFPYPLREGNAQELIRKKESDLFR